MKVSDPTNGSFMILKASAAKGSSSLDRRTIGSSVPGFTPRISATPAGLGSKSTTASRRGCTPLVLEADLTSTGTTVKQNAHMRDRKRGDMVKKVCETWRMGR